MSTLDRVVSPRASGVSTAVTLVVAAWLTFAFVVTLGALVIA